MIARRRVAWEQARQHRESRVAEVRVRRQTASIESSSPSQLDLRRRRAPATRGHHLADLTRRKEARSLAPNAPAHPRSPGGRTPPRRPELHDSVIQILSSVKFGSRRSRKTHRQGRRRLAGRAQGQAHLEKAIQEVRRISRNLRPSELDDLGLAPPCAACAESLANAPRLHRPLHYPAPAKSLDGHQLNLYRIIQSSRQHRKTFPRHPGLAPTARQSSQLRTAIRDNGRGFDPLSPRGKSQNHRMGLVDMKERPPSSAARASSGPRPAAALRL